MKITKKKIKMLIADERKASKEYKSYGFHSLSKDELKHKNFLIKLYNKRNGFKKNG